MFALSELRDIEERTRVRCVADLEPEDVPVAYAMQVFELFVTIERLGASAKTLVARRVEEAGGYRSSGCRSTAEQLAKAAGTSTSATQRMLDTSKQLAEQPAVSTRCVTASCRQPATEQSRRCHCGARHRRAAGRTAKTSTFAELHKACLAARATGDRDADHPWIKAEPVPREWSDREGAWNLRACGTLEDRARFRNVIEPIIDEIFNDCPQER